MHFTTGNQIKLLRNGAEYFPALAHAIAQAQHEIYLQTYIYQQDATGIYIGNALKQAALRGVAVKVLLDGFGCQDLAKTDVRDLEQSGVQVMFYRANISPWTLQKRRLRRMHRKIVVIDGSIGFVGGINIIDDNHALEQTSPRIDYAVQINGPVLVAVLKSVQRLWRRMAWLRLKQAPISTLPLNTSTAPLADDKGVKVAFVIRDNVLHRHDIEKAYLMAIAAAQHEIIIANAYFVPGRKFRQALQAAATRGVRIKLLLQGRKEYLLMFATHVFYSELLRAGIEIYEYRKSFMHSKVAVIDTDWATVGSSNIDPFSLMLSSEANVVIQDAAFAAELKNEINASIQGAFHITTQEWQHNNRFKHFLSWVAYLFIRVLLGIIGYSNE